MPRAQEAAAKRAIVGTLPTRHMVSITEASLATKALASSKPASTTCKSSLHMSAYHYMTIWPSALLLKC